MPCGNYSNDLQKCIDGYFLRITVPLAGVVRPPRRRHELIKFSPVARNPFSRLKILSKAFKAGHKGVLIIFLILSTRQ